MSFLDELVKRLASKGDVGAFSLGFVVAYLVELKFALMAGLAPGTAGSLGAAAALGLKNTVEALWNRSAPESDRATALEKVANRIRHLDLSSPLLSALEEIRAAVLADHEVWSAGLISDDEFGSSIQRFVDPYRAAQRGIILHDLAAKMAKR